MTIDKRDVRAFVAWEWLGAVEDHRGTLKLMMRAGDVCIDLPNFTEAKRIADAINQELRIAEDRGMHFMSRKVMQTLNEWEPR